MIANIVKASEIKSMFRVGASAFLGAAITAFFGAVICLSILYLASVGYGFATGFGLPTTAIFYLIPAIEVVIGWEPSLSTCLLVVAALGAIVSWAGWLGLLEQRPIGDSERNVQKFLRFWGTPTITCALLIIISSGGWAGRYTAHPSSGFSLLNLIPFSDAITYFGSALDRATMNMWGEAPSRRPLAQSLRDTIVFLAGYSQSGAVLLQTALIALGMSLTAGRIAAWRGLWPAIAFIGFTVGLSRAYLGTMMTEPLAWALAYFSCAYLCDAIRFRSSRHALVALTGLTMALVVRAGSMLTVPFMIVWLAFAFASDLRSRLHYGLSGLLCAGVVFLISAFLGLVYPPPHSVGAGSISLTLCGLSVGGNWGDCYRLYADEIARLNENQPAIMQFLYERALSNIINDPSLLWRSLVTNAITYISDLPKVFMTGINHWPVSRAFVVILLLIGLARTLWKQSARHEAMIWVGFFLSTVASASIVYADDGIRAMQVTYVILALPRAFAFSPPVQYAHNDRPISCRIGATSLVLVTLCAIIGPAASHAVTARWISTHVPPFSAKPNETIILGPFGVSRFLVLPDDTERPVKVPSVYFSEFEKIAEVNGFKRDYAFDIGELQIKPPFAFIIGMRVNLGCCYYLTEPEVLTGRTTKAWHLIPLRGDDRRPIREMHAVRLK